MSDNVNNPEHYTYGKIKCIDLIEQVTERTLINSVQLMVLLLIRKWKLVMT